MNIELKNVKYAAFASEETSCFEATVYIDGKRAGTAHNDGHGGSTYMGPRELTERLDAYGKTLPKKPLGMNGKDGEPMFYEQNAETIIDDLLADYLITRDVKRWLASKIMFTKVGKRGIFETKKLPKEALAKHLANPALRTKIKGCDKILNLLPISDAVQIFKAESEAHAA